MSRATVTGLDEARQAREALALARLGMELGECLARVRAIVAEMEAGPPVTESLFAPRHLKAVR